MTDLETEASRTRIAAQAAAFALVDQHQEDMFSASAVERLAALFDVDRLPGEPGALPPLGHWLHFLPADRQSRMGADGHPRRDGASTFSRRMWAGGEVHFLEPAPLGEKAVRRTVVENFERKNGKAGALVFVTVSHVISVAGRDAISERQDIVFLEKAPPYSAGKASDRTSQFTQVVDPDIVALFRYSALTFNGHRIHYDLDYVRDVEGYPGLLVHGPYQATMLLYHALARCPERSPLRFSFRAERPLVAGKPFQLCLAEREGGYEMWSLDVDGAECMRAEVDLD
ncbi:hypothetical protein [Sphingopyxis sp. MC1]|uniref:hypothetical protein n=1 Tax=Sphingopyxis sp. MC1 TaxID=1174684 RepID=UPI0002D1EFC8|nr:hypothetical protein [Sphingopyxis sp. MC1]ENY80195.1 hypothetical protein EBMC1_15579 [Sphingopyxis sp. MC1]